MADTTNDIWNDNDGEEDEAPRKGGRLRRFGIFFLVLAAVLGVVLVAAYRDGTGFDALRRLFSYGSGEESTAEAQYDYDASDSNRFAVLGDSLVVLSDTKLQVLTRGGEEIWSTSVRMSAPALETGGGRAVAYDVGGTELYVVDEGGEILTLTAPEDAPYFSARLNEDGWLAVTTELPGYKGGVTAYNSQGTEVFSLTASDRFVIDARVTDDDNTLAVVTLGQENSVFVSNMVLYSLETAGNVDPAADYDVTDGLVAAVGEQDGQLVTVSDTCLTYASPAGGACYLLLCRQLSAGIRLARGRLHRPAAEPIQVRRCGPVGDGGHGRAGDRRPGRERGDPQHLRCRTVSGGAVYGQRGDLHRGAGDLCSAGGHGLRPVGSDAPGWLRPAAGGRERPPVPALSGKH